MKAYVLAVAGMALLTAIVSVLIPEKKFGKTINGVLKLCMLLTLVSPIFQYVRQDTPNFLLNESIFGQDTAYINNSYALAIKTQIENQYDITIEVNVTFEEKQKRVTIYIRDFGMNEKEEHINIINQITETVKKLSNADMVEVFDET